MFNNISIVYRDIIILIVSFVFVFIFSLNFFYDIPLQSEIITYFFHIFKPVEEFQELLMRSPVERFFGYFLMSKAPKYAEHFSSNLFFYFFYFVHFLNTIFIYFMVRYLVKITNKNFYINIPFWVSILFLFQQIGIECFPILHLGFE